VIAANRILTFADKICALVLMHYTVQVTDDFGRFDTRGRLLRFFEFNRYHIVRVETAGSRRRTEKWGGKDVGREDKLDASDSNRSSPVSI